MTQLGTMMPHKERGESIPSVNTDRDMAAVRPFRGSVI